MNGVKASLHKTGDLRAVAGHLNHLFRHVMFEHSTLCVWAAGQLANYGRAAALLPQHFFF